MGPVMDFTFTLAHNLTPSEFAEITGTSDGKLRDWRNRGLLDGYGNFVAGQMWRYSREEVIKFSVADQLSAWRLEIGERLQIARQTVDTMVSRRVYHRRAPTQWGRWVSVKWKGGYYSALPLMEDQSVGGLFPSPRPEVMVIDTWQMVDHLSEPARRFWDQFVDATPLLDGPEGAA